MTETIGQPENDFPREPRATRSHSRGGMTGYGKAPIIATGVLMTAGVALGGWGIAHMFTDGDSAMAQALSSEVVQEEKPVEDISVVQDGYVYMKLRDTDGDGQPDTTEMVKPPKAVDPAAVPLPPAPEPAAPALPAPVAAPEPVVQTISEGQTLSTISGETGVPIDLLMAANGIQNPNLIYAGAALIIPPVG